MYHDDLLNDKKRVQSFKNAIEENAHGIVYDLGTGSGILAQIASKYADKVYAIEINPFTIKNAKINLEKYDNIKLINTDEIKLKYPEKPDVIICEMLDTALIDEEQVPVINNSLKYKTKNTIYIPKSVNTTVEAVNTDINYISYYENNKPTYESLSDEISYHNVSFDSITDPFLNKEIKIPIICNGLCNAIKLTTYTKLTNTIICEPTPMLNPPLIIPVNNIEVKNGDELLLNLKYIMGGGLNSIHTNIRKID